MTLPRTLVVTLLNLLPAAVRRRLIVAILRRFLRPPARTSGRRTLRRAVFQLKLSVRVHARGVVGTVARAGHHTAQAARALVSAALAVLDRAAGRLALASLPLLHRLRLALARLHVPSGAQDGRALDAKGAAAFVARQPALHGLGLARREHARPSGPPRRPRLALAALEDWLRWDSDPPWRTQHPAGVIPTRA
jgi:hypothetical protein